MVIVRKNSAVLTEPIVLRGLLPWTSRCEVTIGAPAAAARRIEESADQPERRDDLRAPFSVWRCMTPR